MVKLSIRQKILALVLAVGIIPFALVNAYWITVQRHTLLNNSEGSQAAVTNDDADDVNLFISDEVRALIYRSQDLSLDQGENSKDLELDLGTLLAQDKNITRLAVADKSGKETLALANNGTHIATVSDANNPAFEAVSKSANQYISSATIDASGHPVVTIAVPVMGKTTPQNLAGLLSSDTRPASSPLVFNGVLIANVDFQVLWTAVLNQSINAGAQGSYAYVVDDKGNVIAYPKQFGDEAGVNLAKVPIVRAFLTHTNTTTDSAGDVSGSLQAQSEKNVPVLASYQKIDIADWAIVVEDPLTNIYTGIDQVTRIGIGLAIVVILLLAFISIYLSGYLTRPILKIAEVADRIGKGDLNAQVTKLRGDEIGTLGRSINAMGQNLKVSIGRIEDQRRQLEAILNNTTDAILSVDYQGKILIANSASAQFFESTSDVLLGQSVSSLLTHTTGTKPVNLDFTVLGPGLTMFTELTYVSPGQQTHFIDIVVFKISGSNDQDLTGQSIITIRDETKRRELDNMKVDFVSMAAHELRTPLSAIQGYLELVNVDKLHTNLPEKIKTYLAHAQMSARELGSLMSNLLNVTRLEHGTLHMHMEKVDLATKAADTVRNSQFNAASKDVSLTYAGPSAGCEVIADPATLQEVMNNLVDNAIKYTPQNGKVEVTLGTGPSGYELAVTDTGIGIPKEALPHLFTKFYRVHNGLETGSAGTGLGLYLAKTILENYDGKITVDSEEGKGTVFKVLLPLYSETRFQEILASQPEEAFNKGGKRGWATKNINR